MSQSQFEKTENYSNSLKSLKAEDFMKYGIFEHISLPIPEDEDIPAEVLEHVFGSKFEEVRIDLDSIRQHLNNLPKTVEDFPKEV